MLDFMVAKRVVALGTRDPSSRQQSHDGSSMAPRPEASGLRPHSGFAAQLKLELEFPVSLQGYFSWEERQAFQVTQGERPHRATLHTGRF